MSSLLSKVGPLLRAMQLHPPAVSHRPARLWGWILHPHLKLNRPKTTCPPNWIQKNLKGSLKSMRFSRMPNPNMICHHLVSRQWLTMAKRQMWIHLRMVDRRLLLPRDGQLSLHLRGLWWAKAIWNPSRLVSHRPSLTSTTTRNFG